MNGIFEECEIGPDSYTFLMIDKFDPPPVGRSKEEDFDPTVHLELIDDEVEDLEEENNNLLEEDESLYKVQRKKVNNLYKIWLTITP